MRRGIVGILLLGAVAVVAGLVGYQAGTAAGAATAGATVVVTGGFPWAGALFLLFLILFVGFPLFALAGMRRAAMHRGPWGHGWAGPGGPGATGVHGGPGSWSSSDDPRRRWIAEMHRSLHAAEAAGTAQAAHAAEAAGTAGMADAADPAPRRSAGPGSAAAAPDSAAGSGPTAG